MHVLIAAIVAAVAIVFLLSRAWRAVGVAKQLNRETRPLQHKAKDALAAVIGTPLGRLRDPALAGAVLMVQIIRSEGAMTAEEKSAILDRLGDVIGAADPQSLFERAWPMTAQGGFFSQTSDQLAPMLNDRLTPDERRDLIAMLASVADTRGGASDLQRDSIARLSKRLLA